jgi:hypothetical protein
MLLVAPIIAPFVASTLPEAESIFPTAEMSVPALMFRPLETILVAFLTLLGG